MNKEICYEHLRKERESEKKERSENAKKDIQVGTHRQTDRQ